MTAPTNAPTNAPMTVLVPLPPDAGAGGRAVDDATVLAAWAVVRGAALRAGTVTVPLRAQDRTGVVTVELDALTIGAELLERCAAGIAGLDDGPGPDPASRQDPDPGQDPGQDPDVDADPDAVPADGITLLLGPPDAALRFRPSAVDPLQVELLAGLLARTAGRLGQEPATPLERLRAFPGERVTPPDAWRQAAERGATEPPLARHREFSAWARRDPDRLAVLHGTSRMTYAELDERANRLANLLIARGVGPDVAVAVCLPAGFDLVVGLLAVVKAGGCYLPVDPSHPAARIAFLLNDADARVVLAADGVPLPAGERPVIRPDTAQGRELIAASPATAPAEPKEASRRLGYLLYTSGSTGEPKGVAVTEHAVNRLLRAVSRRVSVRAGDAVLFSSSPAFDISTVEVFLPLVSGAHIVVADRDQVRDPGELARLIDQHRVRLVQATPSAWRPLSEALAAGGRREQLQVVAAGEPLSPELSGRLLAVAGLVLNGYGPTETTIYTTLATITDPDDVTVGEPVDGTALYVVDERDRPLPAGVPGELLIGGGNVGRGYLSRPRLTAERFVPDTFGGEPGARLYRSGDLAWWAPDGRLRVAGRIDAQVKVRGHRIEPGEVEARLNAHPDVDASVVRARSFGPGDTRLVAFVVTTGGKPFTLAALRDWCAVTLPDYLVPTVCLTLPRFPLTGSGKLDERALPGPAEILARQGDAEPGPDGARAAPETAAERAVARIWQKALWADDLARDDDFFALGGDSLLATQVTRELQREFLLEVPIQAIFLFPTVAELAAAVVRARRTGRVDVTGGAGRVAASRSGEAAGHG